MCRINRVSSRLTVNVLMEHVGEDHDRLLNQAEHERGLLKKTGPSKGQLLARQKQAKCRR